MLLIHIGSLWSHVFLLFIFLGRERLNLALNQFAEQVDTHSSRGVASKAVDGNRDGRFL